MKGKTMTQKIFDTDNAEDMALLWSILPDEVLEIRKNVDMATCFFAENIYWGSIPAEIIKINWHNKTEIIRPIPEATEADIGKLCKFWDSENGLVYYGILNSIGSTAYRLQNTYPYTVCYHHCRRLTKQEIEELI